MIEAVCTMVLVGLSLDYVLHVAGAYVRTSGADGRRERAKGAVRAVGLSVVSGASTTVGAAAFLLGCTLTFFTKFGLFVAWTLTSSLVQAVVVFPAMAPCGFGGRGESRGQEDEQEGWRNHAAEMRANDRYGMALDLHVTSHHECQQHPRAHASRRQRRLTVQRCPEVVVVDYYILRRRRRWRWRRRHRRRRCRG